MNFNFYKADAEYCDFLRKSDPCVPYTMDEKNTRPFIGIVFAIRGFSYFAPLTSPKPKHMKMKNKIDFLKINGGKWGAINFNNMVPIHPDCLEPVDIKILPTDDKATIAYKNLLSNQLSWCNTQKNKASIIRKAAKLYFVITEKTADPELLKRCCNFELDERQCIEYCKIHNLSFVENPIIEDKKTPVNEQIADAEPRADAHNSGLLKDNPDRGDRDKS